MVDTAKRIHPLENRLYGHQGTVLEPVAAMERVSLRAEEKAVKGLGQAIGVSLPDKPRATTEKDGTLALCIGPDEWLILAPTGADIEAKLNGVEDGLYSAVSIDHRNTGMRLTGPVVEAILNAGCPQDISMEAFPIGTCARTIIGKAEVVLYRKSEQEFHIECWRSFSDYVWKFLVDAARTN